MMKVAVWDTYVKRSDGKIMHFDILVDSNLKNEQIIFDYGKQYLDTKTFISGSLTQKVCTLCHIDQVTDEVEAMINKNGYVIIEIENCD